jgi:hypothetical protein
MNAHIQTKKKWFRCRAPRGTPPLLLFHLHHLSRFFCIYKSAHLHSSCIKYTTLFLLELLWSLLLIAVVSYFAFYSRSHSFSTDCSRASNGSFLKVSFFLATLHSVVEVALVFLSELH